MLPDCCVGESTSVWANRPVGETTCRRNELKESIKSDLVLQDLAPVGKAVIPKLSRTKYGIDGASWSFA